MKRSELQRTKMQRAPKGFWICRRQENGVKCLNVNPNRKQLCEACGKRKPKKSKPKHMEVLATMSYEEFVEIAGSETCEICGAAPKARRLHRDHDHNTGRARGLLCFQCNSIIPRRVNLAWARRLVAYLERAEARWEREDYLARRARFAEAHRDGTHDPDRF